MTCRELAEQLLDFLSGELTQEYRAQVEEHICCCPHCEAFVHSYKITVTLTRKLPSRPLPSGLSQRLNNLLKEITDSST